MPADFSVQLNESSDACSSRSNAQNVCLNISMAKPSDLEPSILPSAPRQSALCDQNRGRGKGEPLEELQGSAQAQRYDEVSYGELRRNEPRRRVRRPVSAKQE